jgi:hypothetical protein
MPAISKLQVQQISGYISDIIATTCIFCMGRPVSCPERPFSWPLAAVGHAGREGRFVGQVRDSGLR